MSKDATKRILTDLEKVLATILPAKFEDETPNIIDVGIEAYEDLLLGLVVNSKSLSDPANFYDAYIMALKDFTYIDEESEDIKLLLPDEESFDFSGDLEVLKFIVEGTNGTYLELPENDLNTVLNTKEVDPKVKRRLRDLPGIHTTNVPVTMRFSLLPTRGTLAVTVQAILDKKLLRFPFSNQPPIELFAPTHVYVDENIGTWVDESIEKAIKFTKQKVY